MELNKKELYLSPEVKTFEMKTEGVICQSLPGAEVENYGWNIVPEE